MIGLPQTSYKNYKKNKTTSGGGMTNPPVPPTQDISLGFRAPGSMIGPGSAVNTSRGVPSVSSTKNEPPTNPELTQDLYNTSQQQINSSYMVGDTPQPPKPTPTANIAPVAKPTTIDLPQPTPTATVDRAQAPSLTKVAEIQPGVPQEKVYENPYEISSRGDEALNLYTKRALGDDPMVANETKRVQQLTVARTAQAKRQAHEEAVRAGYQPGSLEYQSIMNNYMDKASRVNKEMNSALHDFINRRRSASQGELENLFSGEYERGRESTLDQRNRFQDFVKYLPSDKAQQMAALDMAMGGDIGSTMAKMYDESGTLKPEYQDKTKVELEYQGLSDRIDMLTNMTPEQKETMKNELYSTMIGNIFAPATTQGKTTEFSSESFKDFDEAVKRTDFTGMDDTQLFYVFQNDPGAIKNMKEGGVPALSGTKELAADAFKSYKDFLDAGYKVDKADNVVPSQRVEGSVAGDQGGSVVLVDGRPARLVEFDDDGLGRTHVHWQYLDEDPKNRKTYVHSRTKRKVLSY